MLLDRTPRPVAVSSPEALEATRCALTGAPEIPLSGYSTALTRCEAD